MHDINNKSAKNKSKDIKKILTSYLNYWYLFAIGLVICIVLAFLYLRYNAVPQYQVSSIMLVNDKGQGTTTNKGESFSDLGLVKPSGNIQDQIGILKSYNLMELVVKDLSLQVSYFMEGNVNDIEVYGDGLPINVLLNQSKTESLSYEMPITVYLKNKTTYELEVTTEDESVERTTHKFGEEINKPYGTFTIVLNSEQPFSEISKKISFKFSSVRDVTNTYTEKLTVEPEIEEGNLLILTLLDAIPQKGMDVLNKLMDVYAEEAVKYENQMSLSTIDLIDERLRLLTGELTDVEKNVESYKQQRNLTNVNANAEQYVEQAGTYRRQLVEYQTRIAVLNSIENYLQKDNDNAPTVPSSLTIEDPTLVGLISKFNDLQLQRRRLMQTTPKSNPIVVDLEEQISNLRVNIIENLKNIKEGLLITQRNLEQTTRQFESQIGNVPTVERGLNEINRQQSTKTELYLYLLQKREEEALSLAAPISNARVVDPARAGNYPVSPNKTSFYLGAIIFGLFIPFGFVYIKDKMNTKIGGIEDINSITDAPILGEIAHKESQEVVVANTKNTSAVAELFRLIRFNLKFATAGRPNKVILITSSVKGEGKTFFTINLGVSLASSGKKVVLLSFDLRAPKLTESLGIKNDKGITDYLVTDTIEVSDLIEPVTAIDGLYAIASGPIPPNTGELMLNQRVKTLIDALQERFDYVLIDSAPVGRVADAFALTDYVDSTLYLVRQNYTIKADLEDFDTTYRENKLNKPMLVLNDVKMSKEKSYGYGGK
ncbi:MAG TPA: polysaccharide biosynthesis tyrosine autokinase [Leeuwenhoekiella sp.]|nr:polysaccharide biosynthesis tyrosine autokinase [Leeuwenhoekiella sp.]